MNKYLLLTLLCACSTSLCFSQISTVSLVDVKDHVPNHNHAVPSVTYDKDDISISCDSVIHDVNIVIRDQHGNVLHQSTQTVSPSETTISVANMGSGSEKSTIDLYYDRKHLYGEFDE